MEAGVEAEPEHALAADSQEWRALEEGHPELVELRELADAVILRVEGDVLRREALRAAP